jgi:hypothetical protein
MAKITARIRSLERHSGVRGCIACARVPRHFMIRNATDLAECKRRMDLHTKQCICHGTIKVKRIILHSPQNDVPGGMQ